MRGFQQPRRHGRRKDDRHDQRDRHGRDHGDRELPVDHPGGSAEEGHRQEDRRQHHVDPDERRGDLAHRAFRRLEGRELLFLHQALDVLDDHDGVIDQQADGQHHGEHGQRVDRIARHHQHPESAQQHHRHGDERHQRGAPALQEDQQNREHQHDCLEERVINLLDRQLDEGRGVIGGAELHPLGQRGAQPVELRAHGGGGVHGVGASFKVHPEARGVEPVEARVPAVALLPDLDPRNVAEPHHPTLFRRAQQDGLEFVHGGQLALGGNGRGELLAPCGGLLAERADRDGGVLRRDRAHHIRRGELVARQRQRIEPDAHGIARAEALHAADALGALDRPFDRGGHDVAQLDRAVGAGGVDQRADHEDRRGGPRDAHPLALHRARQAALDLTDLGLHLVLGVHRIDALVEGDLDRGPPLGRAGGHVEHAFEAGHRVLDLAGHRVLHRLGGGAAVAGRDPHRGGGDVRILADGQGDHGQGPRQHGEDRQHPGKDRARNKEISHAVSPLPAYPQRARARHRSCRASRRRG